MSSPADVIYQLLIDLGLGSSSGEWPVFVGFLPDSPDEAICVYDTAGMSDGRYLATGYRVEHPGIQIRVRGKDYQTTFEKVQSIAETLDLQSRIVVVLSSEEAYSVINVSRTGTILPLGIDEATGRRCHHFSLNAVLTLSPSP